MRSSLIAGTVVAVLVVLVGGGTAPAGAADGEVAVVDNAFEPDHVRVEPGEEVTWTWSGAASHTVTFEDGTDSGQRTTGTWSRRFPDAGTFAYLCRLHGDMGMKGVVQVGDGATETPVAGVVYVPSDGVPLSTAVRDASPGTTIVLEPGEHLVRQPLVVSTEGVTIRGGRRPTAKEIAASGADPTVPRDVDATAVVVTSPGATPYAFVVTARGDEDPRRKLDTAVLDLTITNFRLGAIRVEGANGFRLGASPTAAGERRDLRLLDAGGGWEHGIVVVRSTRGRIVDVEVTGARYAGVSIQDCSPCDTTTRRVTVTDSFVGFEALSATHGVHLVSSTFERNATGIVVRTSGDPGTAAALGTAMWDNTVRDPSAEVPTPTMFQPERLQTGLGPAVWLSSASRALVHSNRLAGDRYGVAVTGGRVPSDRNIVRNNTIAAHTSLAWDGLGRGTCFTGNVAESGELTSNPVAIETLYPCSRPTVGVPNPTVTADLALTALHHYYCQRDGRLCG